MKKSFIFNLLCCWRLVSALPRWTPAPRRLLCCSSFSNNKASCRINRLTAVNVALLWYQQYCVKTKLIQRNVTINNTANCFWKMVHLEEGMFVSAVGAVPILMQKELNQTIAMLSLIKPHYISSILLSIEHTRWFPHDGNEKCAQKQSVGRKFQKIYFVVSWIIRHHRFKLKNSHDSNMNTRKMVKPTVVSV